MSDQETSPSARSNRPKTRRVKTEDDIIREILKLQKKLIKDHKTASLFSCSSKFGLLQFGSNKVVEKFKIDSVAWENAFDEDDDELIDGTQFAETEEEEDYDALNDLRSELVPKKLPAVVELMSYEELWKYVSQEVLKEHWKKGGKSKCVKFGHPEFSPSFWLEDVWAWECVNKHP